MNRRGFLSGILLAAAAPAIVRADSLMRIVSRDLVVARPDLDDVIWHLQPKESPFMGFGEKATGHEWVHEWVTDELPVTSQWTQIIRPTVRVG